MNYRINLRGIGSHFFVIVPKKPIETENKQQFEVLIHKGDGTLDRVYRFEKYSVISIMECK